MLKIKDNVDLKELEKFGFQNSDLRKNRLEHRNYNVQLHIDTKINSKNFRRIYVSRFGGKAPNIITWDVLFDLIKSDLVEKVEEE